MPLLLHLTLMVVSFLFHEHEAIAQYIYPYTSAIVPVNKHIDAVKPLYSVGVTASYINSQTLKANFLIDLDAPLNWHDCILRWNIVPNGCPVNTPCTYPVSCDEYVCTDVRTAYTYENPKCPPVTNDSTTPGWGCTCPVRVIDPVTGSCGQASLDYDEFVMKTTDGRDITATYGVNPNAACAPSSSFGSFPKNVTGVMALSTSRHALPAYLFQPIKKLLALCLPSTVSAPGVLFFGTGPYYLPPQSDLDATTLLSYTPLIKRQDSYGYFIGVNKIAIKKRSIEVLGDATTKLSTIDPYSILRTDIYTWVVRRFSMVTKRIPRAEPVEPFGLCFSTVSNGSSRVSLKVPDIELGLRDGKKWPISTTNSIKQVTKDVACLAFVDGGAIAEPPVVIGAFQFEDNFVVFDLENSSLGFSSSLLSKHVSCANFNFTLT
ncbi:hypothetical protein OSB04_019124 [Centaurea solstitialis]|uniref:Peptidase A1 domain-containing protein n=1 Tax=Centaurea solstitialis TaxID=347529 RepID=A0AA38T182_9ASTR|nr:hypothetical protein OSB04_019124 [Centaurea solstitialis]